MIKYKNHGNGTNVKDGKREGGINENWIKKTLYSHFFRWVGEIEKSGASH